MIFNTRFFFITQNAGAGVDYVIAKIFFRGFFFLMSSILVALQLIVWATEVSEYRQLKKKKKKKKNTLYIKILVLKAPKQYFIYQT